MADFALLQTPKLISRGKILVIGKSCNFYTVNLNSSVESGSEIQNSKLKMILTFQNDENAHIDSCGNKSVTFSKMEEGT